MRERKRRRVQANRAAQQERRRRPRKGRHDRAWRHLTRGQQEVARRLMAGQIDLVTISGWGMVSSFLAFPDEVRFFALLDLKGKGFKPVLFPIARLILTAQLKMFLGIGSITLVPAKLFREIALRRLIGYTTTQMQVGFSQRGHLDRGSMHQNPLADAVERRSAGDRAAVLSGTARRLAERGFFATSRGHVALDASDLPTTDKDTGAGLLTKTEKKVTKDKKIVEVERHVSGFQVFVVCEVRLRLIVAATVVPIQERETQHTLALVRQAIANVGTSTIKVILMDRGFLDGAALWVFKHEWGIDFVVPAKDTLRVTTDARQLSRRAADGESIFAQERNGTKKERKDGRMRWEGQVTVMGVAAPTRYGQDGTAEHAAQANRRAFVGNTLNAVVVTRWQGEEYAPGEETVFLTSLPTEQPLRVLDLDDVRSLMENTAFRELKQGWGLEHHPKKTEAAVRGYVLLTLVTFTLVNAFRTARGQDLAQRGVRRQRAEEETAKVIIFARDHYGIFDIEEVFVLLGVVPRLCFTADPAHVRHRYGFSSVA